MVSINATLVFQVVQLLVLIFILNRIMFRPILKLTTERDSFLEKSKVDMRNMESEVERLRGVFLSKEADARKRASREGLDLKNAAMTEVERILEESSKSAAGIRSEAEQAARAQIETTKPLLAGEAEILADDIVGRIIGRRLGA
jgi:F-type H+-transporting ATPase subunit b